MMIAMLLVVVAGIQADDQADKAIEAFRKAWRKPDEAARAAAITAITNYRHPKILRFLIEKLRTERSPYLREGFVGAVGRYLESPEAAEALVKELKGNRKSPNVVQAALQRLAGMKPDVTRPHVGAVNVFVKAKDVGLATSAVRGLAYIRHKSSVEPLIERLRRCQQDMKKFIAGSRLPTCSESTCGITCNNVQDLLSQYKTLNEQKKAAWQAVDTYAALVPTILDALKSITGKSFTTYRDYDRWWAANRKKFEVID